MHLTAVKFHFLIFKTGLIILTLQGYCKDEIELQCPAHCGHSTTGDVFYFYLYGLPDAKV